MALSKSLIDQFAKAISIQDTKDAETIIEAKYIKSNNIDYVKVKGSENLTPVEMTVNAKDGDDVLVEIKEHRAIVKSNMTSPASSSADYTELSAQVNLNKGSILDLKETVGVFESSTFTSISSAVNAIDSVLQIYNTDIGYESSALNVIRSNISAIDSEVFIRDSQGHIENSKIDLLNSEVFVYDEHGEIIGFKIRAIDSNVQILNSGVVIDHGKVTGLDSVVVNSLKSDYAEIDFANIGTASIEKIFAETGLIPDLTVTEQLQVSGHLSAVEIDAAMITTGKLKADRIYLLNDSDGLYYALNTNAETTGISQDEFNSLSGSILTRKSVNAEKVSVNDLSAFEATLGGFVLNQHSIYSLLKPAVDSPHDGLYMNDSGELAFGNDDEHIIYSKDDDDNYNLDIKATSGNVYIGDEDNHISFGKDSEGNMNLDISAESVKQEDGISVGQSIRSLSIDLKNGIEGIQSDIQENYYTKEDTGNTIDSKISTFKQTADEIYMSVGNAYTKEEINNINNGTDEVNKVSSVKTATLTIDNSGLRVVQSDRDTTTHINASGLIVLDKNEQDLLRVTVENGEGVVETKNLHSQKYLIIGNNSRLEDADFGTTDNPIPATAVYWIGGDYGDD